MPTIKKAERKKSNYQKHDKNAEIAKIYNTSTWKNLRLAYLMEHPLCERCLENDIITASFHVHHKYEISNGNNELEMKDIAYNPNNLEALCAECHRLEHLNRKNNGNN